MALFAATHNTPAAGFRARAERGSVASGAGTHAGHPFHGGPYGNVGTTTIRGGGNDVIYGDAGNDTFVFQVVSGSPRGGQDAIRDFRTGDRIDLSDIATNASNGRFDFAEGAAKLSGAADEPVATYRADTSTATGSRTSSSLW